MVCCLCGVTMIYFQSINQYWKSMQNTENRKFYTENLENSLEARGTAVQNATHTLHYHDYPYSILVSCPAPFLSRYRRGWHARLIPCVYTYTIHSIVCIFPSEARFPLEVRLNQDGFGCIYSLDWTTGLTFDPKILTSNDHLHWFIVLERCQEDT